MSDAWKKSPEFLGWLKAPSADRYVRDLLEQRDAAAQAMFGAASVSDDPKVRERHAAWKVLNEVSEFLRKSRKESAVEDE